MFLCSSTISELLLFDAWEWSHSIFNKNMRQEMGEAGRVKITIKTKQKKRNIHVSFKLIPHTAMWLINKNSAAFAVLKVSKN